MTGSRQVRSFDVSANDNNGRLLRGVASLHHRTPTLLVNDSRGLPVRQVDYLRKVDGGTVEGLVNRQLHDAVGRLAEQWDPRLFASALKPNLATVYTLTGEPLKVDSIDAGWRLCLPGLAGEALQRWDARGSHWRMNYDNQLRILAVAENAQPDVETFTYANASANAAHNLRGQMTALKDPSGTVTFHGYGLLGQSLRETRTLDAEAFLSHRTYSACGALLTQVDAGGHRQQLHYDRARQLNHVSLHLAGAAEPEAILHEAHYNAAGQLTEQLGGNGVLSSWFYDPANSRLLRLLAQKDQEKPLQDFHFTYDPVGNVLRIEDHSLATVHFANQQIDGHRQFIYDSLYRLTESHGFEGDIPHLQPGLPAPIRPIDPGRRFNYTEHYEYDAGNNLTELRHVREGHNLTRQMRIAPHSNRGVRWQAGDPDPVFDEHFDPHGNQLCLQPGTLPLAWNSRDQLARVTVLQHSNGLPDDEETYRYSQGERVYKCSLAHTPSNTHRREVRYLPGLEIHIRNDGQQLHVIVLPGARCLHWVSGQPAGVEADQLRYSLDDHLGSCSLELDRQGGVISLEFYYAFGGTAWWATRSELEASYKTVRYSGKEMDASGLYYYGARYYAPWLQRWISPDPVGDVDGLNLYRFVANNPLRYIDQLGTQQEESSARQKLIEHADFLATTNRELKKLNYQLYNLTRTRDIYRTAGKKLLFSVASFAVTIKAGAFGAVVGGGAASLTGPAAPVLVPVAAATTGIFFADAANKVMEKLGDETTLGYAITPDPVSLSVTRLKGKASTEQFSIKAVVKSFSPDSSAGLTKLGIETTARVIGKHLKVPYLKQALAFARQASQLTEALNGAFGQGDLDRISAQLDALDRHLDKENSVMLQTLETLTEADAMGSPVLIGAASMPEKASQHDRAAIEQETTIARGKIKHARNLISRVSQYLAQTQHAA